MNTPGGAGYTPALGYVSVTMLTGSSSAAFVGVIDPPLSNLATASQASTGSANATPALLTQPSQGFLHITQAEYTVTGGTDSVGLLQPLNWTTTAVGSASAASSGSITLTADPGIYSTNYRPLTVNAPTFPNLPPNVPTNAIAANDYIVYQGQDGTWFADKVAAVAGSTTINVGLTAANPAVKAGSLVYFYGIPTDKDPATGKTRPAINPAAASAHAQWRDPQGAICSTLFAGDPILIYGKNVDNSLVIHSVTGFGSYR